MPPKRVVESDPFEPATQSAPPPPSKAAASSPLLTSQIQGLLNGQISATPQGPTAKVPIAAQPAAVQQQAKVAAAMPQVAPPPSVVQPASIQAALDTAKATASPTVKAPITATVAPTAAPAQQAKVEAAVPQAEQARQASQWGSPFPSLQSMMYSAQQYAPPQTTKTSVAAQPAAGQQQAKVETGMPQMAPAVIMPPSMQAAMDAARAASSPAAKAPVASTVAPEAAAAQQAKVEAAVQPVAPKPQIINDKTTFASPLESPQDALDAAKQDVVPQTTKAPVATQPAAAQQQTKVEAAIPQVLQPPSIQAAIDASQKESVPQPAKAPVAPQAAATEQQAKVEAAIPQSAPQAALDAAKQDAVPQAAKANTATATSPLADELRAKANDAVKTRPSVDELSSQISAQTDPRQTQKAGQGTIASQMGQQMNAESQSRAQGLDGPTFQGRDPSVARPTDFMSFADYGAMNQGQIKQQAETQTAKTNALRTQATQALERAKGKVDEGAPIESMPEFKEYQKLQKQAEDMDAGGAGLGISTNPYEEALRSAYRPQQQARETAANAREAGYGTDAVADYGAWQRSMQEQRNQAAKQAMSGDVISHDVSEPVQAATNAQGVATLGGAITPAGVNTLPDFWANLGNEFGKMFGGGTKSGPTIPNQKKKDGEE